MAQISFTSRRKPEITHSTNRSINCGLKPRFCHRLGTQRPVPTVSTDQAHTTALSVACCVTICAPAKSVLLYGCETWKLTKTIIHQLQVLVNRCIRRILKIFWPVQIPNQELWATAKQKPIELEIRQRKWGWLGHTLRRPPGDITKAALEWNPQGTRFPWQTPNNMAQNNL